MQYCTRCGRSSTSAATLCAECEQDAKFRLHYYYYNCMNAHMEGRLHVRCLICGVTNGKILECELRGDENEPCTPDFYIEEQGGNTMNSPLWKETGNSGKPENDLDSSLGWWFKHNKEWVSEVAAQLEAIYDDMKNVVDPDDEYDLEDYNVARSFKEHWKI